MIPLELRSPWFPILYSAALVPLGAVPRIEPVPFPVWLLWLANVAEPPPQTADDMLAQTHAALALHPQ